MILISNLRRAKNQSNEIARSHRYLAFFFLSAIGGDSPVSIDVFSAGQPLCHVLTFRAPSVYLRSIYHRKQHDI
jgi:hypothetical protein